MDVLIEVQVHEFTSDVLIGVAFVEVNSLYVITEYLFPKSDTLDVTIFVSEDFNTFDS